MRQSKVEFKVVGYMDMATRKVYQRKSNRTQAQNRQLKLKEEQEAEDLMDKLNQLKAKFR